MAQIFEHLMLLGRPASGKSEFIDFMKGVPERERREKYHIGRFEEMDDFPWIWEKFMEDDIWERAGYPRKYSAHYMPGNPGMTPEGAQLLDFCIEKFNIEIESKYLSKPEFYKDGTLIIEFSRGREKAYEKALNGLSPRILEKSSILFIYVSAEESWRRNVARYEEKLKHSILSHMVPKETYDYFYSTHDWLELTKGKPDGYLNVGGIKIPFVTMNNEPESVDPVVLDGRYGKALRRLMELKCE